MPMVKSSKYSPTTIVIIDCACGRNRRNDRGDLAVIMEEDHTAYHGPYVRSKVKVKTSVVVCMREGCLGRWRTNREYIDKLPRVFWKEYSMLKGLTTN